MVLVRRRISGELLRINGRRWYGSSALQRKGWEPPWGNLRENVWESVKKIGSSKSKVRAYSDSEVEYILARSTGAKRLFYWLLVESGMRAGEICGLRVCDADPHRKLVIVVALGGRPEGFVFSTKNGTPWNPDLILSGTSARS